MQYQSALLLNADYQPVRVISWERAMCLLLEEKADLVEGYVGKFVRTVSQSFEYPAVVRLRKFAHQKGKVRFKRSNVLARDSYTCQYCGTAPRNKRGPIIEELTIDHVVPRAHSRNGRVTLPWNGKQVSVTCWENVTTACSSCNSEKRDRTPDEAGMKLRKYPKSPTGVDVLRMSLTRVHIPDEWKAYLPEGSPWGDYWEVELSPE